MDGDHETSLDGRTTTTTTETSYNEALDLLYYRCQTERQGQEVFLAQSTPFLETARETIEVAGEHTQEEDIWRWSVAQVVASWDSFWDEESFYYCHNPDRVRSPESVSYPASIEASSVDGEEIDGDYLSEGTQSDKEYSIVSSRPSFSFIQSWLSTEISASSTPSPTMSPSRVIDPEDPDEGEPLDLPDSERPGLRPEDFGFLPPEYMPQRSPVPATRAEPITVTLGEWEHQVTVTKPNVDYRDIPSPIMMPGSPPQRSDKPSLSGFAKRPPRGESAGFFAVKGGIPGMKIPGRDEEPWQPPPSPALKIPKLAANFMDHPSNSDVSDLNLGSPTQPLTPVLAVSSPDDEDQEPEHDSSLEAVSSSATLSGGPVAATSGSSIMQSAHDPLPSLDMRSSNLLRRRRRPRHDQGHDEGVQPPTILSVDVPEGNDVSWSAPVSPQKLAGVSSPGVVFKLDEELMPHEK